ncbi:hypothetical protein pb186bvf_008618 [Paramecium bursaria]
MNETTSEKSERGRSKERFVWEAMEYVQRWRDLFENGYIDEGGNCRKVTLKQAAEIVGVPKKTLEDYHSVLRKASDQIDLMRVLDRKMGYLRQFLKESKFEPAASKEQVEVTPSEQKDWDNMIIEEEDHQQSKMEFFFDEDQYYFQDYDEYDYRDYCNNPAVPEYP